MEADFELKDRTHRASVEEEQLLEANVQGPGPAKRKSRTPLSPAFYLVCASVVAVLSAGIIVVVILLFQTKGLSLQQEQASSGKVKSVVLMISDGFGPASEGLARSFKQKRDKLPDSFQLPLDDIQVGSSRTRSSDSLVTDSAAGATAFSCALKSYNGAIAVNVVKSPCGTVLEAAHLKGLKTGTVSTSRVTHATPASFNAHVTSRSLENEIAEQQVGDHPLGRVTDLIMGGGRAHFISSSQNGSQRQDSRSLVEEAKAKFGFETVISTRPEFDSLQADPSVLPLLALFTNDHMSYEIDRVPAVEPSLAEMTAFSLKVLDAATKDAELGFFLMVEGSRIDMAAHTNDGATHVHEILAYQEAVSVVKEYVRSHPDVVMISVSDHETGGLAMARTLQGKSEYAWYPEELAKPIISAEKLASMMVAEDTSSPTYSEDVANLIKEKLGIADASDQEVDRIVNAAKKGDAAALAAALVDPISERARIGWSTLGHTAVDVNLYSFGARSQELTGNRENTEIGAFIARSLGLDLAAVTKKLAAFEPPAPLKKPARSEQGASELHYHPRRSQQVPKAPESAGEL